MGEFWPILRGRALAGAPQAGSVVKGKDIRLGVRTWYEPDSG